MTGFIQRQSLFSSIDQYPVDPIHLFSQGNMITNYGNRLQELDSPLLHFKHKLELHRILLTLQNTICAEAIIRTYIKGIL